MRSSNGRFITDARGNMASELREDGVAVTAGYDGQGRLIRYARAGEAALVFAYNGLDDRVLETRTPLSGGGAGGSPVTRRYVYDAGGRLLGEYGANARAVIAEHIWLLPSAANDNRLGLVLGGDEAGYQPLAVAQGSATGSTATTLRWLHGSHLGAPLLQTTASGAPLAASGYTLGAYPGQWRTLDDVHYNRHRDYDPTTGRYLQADPIGLAGGDNPYLYAEGNPLTRIDPEGLNPAAFRGAIMGGRIFGEGLTWLCRNNIALCMRTIGPPAIKVAQICGDILEMAGNNKQKRARIAGLEEHIAKHRKKLMQDPESPSKRG